MEGSRENHFPTMKLSAVTVAVFCAALVCVQGTCNISSMCEDNPTVVLADPENCARYYDCHAETNFHVPPSKHLMECWYPQLFSVETAQCENYTEVDCGDRYEPKNPCDYAQNHCWGNHCAPCFIYYPDCTGFPDGRNVWWGKEGSPYYVECQDGRPVAQGVCPDGQIFDELQRECVPRQQK